MENIEDKQSFASLKSLILSETVDDSASRIERLNELYKGKSSKELLDTLSEERRWTTIHVAEYVFQDPTEGFGAETITTGNSVVVVIPLIGGEIISARHLPSTEPPEGVKGIKIIDFQKSLFKDKDGKIAGQTTKVVSEWLS